MMLRRRDSPAWRSRADPYLLVVTKHSGVPLDLVAPGWVTGRLVDGWTALSTSEQ